MKRQNIDNQMYEELNRFQNSDEYDNDDNGNHGWIKTFGIIFILCLISYLVYQYFFSNSSKPKLVDKINNTVA